MCWPHSFAVITCALGVTRRNDKEETGCSENVQTVNKSVEVLTLQVLDIKFPRSCKKAFTRRVEKEREWILSSCFGTEEAQIPRMELVHPLCLCSPSLLFSVCENISQVFQCWMNLIKTLHKSGAPAFYQVL